MNRIKKVLCVALVLLLLATSVPAIDVSELGFGITASALNATGRCGEDATYTFDSDTGKLTIEGTGKINAEAFYQNNDIKNVVIGDGITEIGADAFKNCDNLTNVDIGAGVTSIGYAAFYGCDVIVKVVIPDNVTYISVFAFAYCCNLEDVDIGDGVVTIDDCAFLGCENLSNVDLGYNIEKIMGSAFAYCKSLKNIIIGDSVTLIGSAFSNCYNLSYVKLGNGITIIGESAFYECRNLINVVLGKCVEEIQAYAFAHCSNINNVSIPKSVTFIGESAFRYCSSLYDVYYEGSEEEWNSIDIREYNTALDNATIHFGEAMPECQHEYVWVAGILSTCINLGVRGHYQCKKCGKFFKNDADKTETTLEELTMPLDLANHEGFTKEVEGTKTPATCVATGSVKMECDCGERKTVVLEINPTAHNIIGVTLTKKDADMHGKKCSNEGCTVWIDEAIHNYTTVVAMTLPTCVTKGSKVTKCACGDEKTEVLNENDNHDWGVYTETKAPTCTEKGSKEAACKREGCSDKDIQEIPALGHDMKEVAAKEATCKEAGNNKYYACDRCDKFFKDEAGAIETTVEAETIAKGEHKFTKYYISKDATCTSNALEKATCDICWEATHERPIPGTMVAHTFKNYVSDGNATCIADGTMTAVCEMCKEAKDTMADIGSKNNAPHVPDKTGRICELCKAELVCTHTYSVEKLITKTPTCTTDGQKAIVCSKCKANKPGSEEVIPATGHAWDEGEVIKAATCNEAGAKKFKCNNKCGETKTEEILATGNHTYSEDKLITITPTCTSEGKKAIVCTNCGEKKPGTEEVIPATHTYPDKWSVVIAPDCQNTGVAVKVCFSCHDVIAQTVPKAGHADLDGDSKCDTCDKKIIVAEPEEPTEPDTPNEPEEKPCDCDCHAGGIKAFFFKLLNFFAKIFDKSARVCECGKSH